MRTLAVMNVHASKVLSIRQRRYVPFLFAEAHSFFAGDRRTCKPVESTSFDDTPSRLHEFLRLVETAADGGACAVRATGVCRRPPNASADVHRSQWGFHLGKRHGFMENSVSAGEPKIWHIYWRAAMGRNLLSDATLVARIRSRLLAAHRRVGRELVYYLLTPTEIHVLTELSAGETPGSLSRGLANAISRWVRESQDTPGPVFMGRYQALGISDVDALRREIHMLAWRPVSMGLCVALTHYRHSALRIALGSSRAEGFHATALLSSFGGSVREGREALRKRVAARPSKEDILQWELAHGLALARGSVGPMGLTSRQVRGAAAMLVAGSESQDINGALGLLERWVASKMGLFSGQGFADRQDAAGVRGRAVVALLAVRFQLCSAASVARHYGRAKATLSEQMAKCRSKPADRQILAIPMAHIVREIASLRPKPA